MVIKSNASLLVFYGTRLRELRISQGLPQTKVAELTGFKRQYVSQAESGKVNLSIDNLGRFLDHLVQVEGSAVPIRLRISINICSARTSLGWSQEHLSSVAGLWLGYVGSLERGLVNASLSKVEALAAALDVDGQWLIEGTLPLLNTSIPFPSV